jgi:imidazole glycerol-phosphate synthase subunit HisF
MLKKRLIATLLIRDELIVQSIGFNKFLPIGHPKFPIEFVVKWDVDEIVLLDISATKEKRSINLEFLELLSQSCFVPLTIGGGIDTIEEAGSIIRNGGDKIAINSAAYTRPELITEIAEKYGTQCVVVSIDCRKESDSSYQVYTHSGTKATGISPKEWAQQAESLGAGEIFLHSIDRDGSKLGYDTALIKSVTDCISIPVIASGGVGDYSHFAKGIHEGGASAVAAGNIFHYIEHSTILAKMHLLEAGIDIRLDSEATYKGREFDKNGRLIMMSGIKLSEVEFKRGKKDFI